MTLDRETKLLELHSGRNDHGTVRLVGEPLLFRVVKPAEIRLVALPTITRLAIKPEIAGVMASPVVTTPAGARDVRSGYRAR